MRVRSFCTFYNGFFAAERDADFDNCLNSERRQICGITLLVDLRQGLSRQRLKVFSYVSSVFQLEQESGICLTIGNLILNCSAYQALKEAQPPMPCTERHERLEASILSQRCSVVYNEPIKGSAERIERAKEFSSESCGIGQNRDIPPETPLGSGSAAPYGRISSGCA